MWHFICLLYRKEFKFVSEVEVVIKNLVELANKVRAKGTFIFIHTYIYSFIHSCVFENIDTFFQTFTVYKALSNVLYLKNMEDMLSWETDSNVMPRKHLE